MELATYVEEFKKAQESTDPTALLQVMQDFFSQIYSLGARETAQILGLYSTAQQLEKMGIDSSVVKQAIKSHVWAQYNAFPATWQDCVTALNELLRKDGISRIY